MPKKDEFIEKAFEVFEQDGIPTERQKDMMLNRILIECKAEDTSGIGTELQSKAPHPHHRKRL